MDFKEKKIFGEKVYNGNLLQVNQDKVLLPDGKESTREWIDHPGAAAVIPLIGKGENKNVIMVKQYRYPIGRETLEIPAGKLDPGETPRECAKRELREETGYSVIAHEEEVLSIGSFFTTPAFTNEIIHLFIAKNLERGTALTDADEFINTVVMSVNNIMNLIKEGEIKDAKTIISFMLAEKKGLL